MDTFKPGDVVIVAIEGALQTKRRPAVVISTEEYCDEHVDILVGLVTTNLTIATTAADHVLLDWQDAGLVSPSAFRAYISTEWKRDVIRCIGQVSERDWIAIQGCLRRALSID